MQEPEFDAYVAKLVKAVLRESLGKVAAYVISFVAVLLSGWFVGAYLGRAAPEGPQVNALAGALFGLLLWWLWVTITVGFTVWKEDQKELGEARKQVQETGARARTPDELLASELLDFERVVGGLQVSAAHVLLACGDLNLGQGARLEAVGQAIVPGSECDKRGADLQAMRDLFDFNTRRGVFEPGHGGLGGCKPNDTGTRISLFLRQELKRRLSNA